MLNTRQCSKCREVKAISDFSKNVTNKSGFNHYCKKCSIKEQKEFRNNNKELLSERSRKYRLKRKFGITVAEYENLLSKQKNKCAICGKQQCDTGRRLAVDHCHKTGRIRGLLCQSCNTALGKFNDSIEMLKSAIKYLKD